MTLRCAVLDDYQGVALDMADWSGLAPDVDVEVFRSPFDGEDEAAAALAPFAIVCAMRERTPFPRSLLARLPEFRLLVTTGLRNAAIDVAAAREAGIVVSGTDSAGHPTAELTFGLILELARQVGSENARMKAGEAWQSVIGSDLAGHTLGLIGLGRLGARVARIAQAFDMEVLAWSQNLTPERCREAGVTHAGRDELLARADVVSIHLQLSERTRGLIGATELGRMKPGAHLVNTSRGPIVDEAALIEALRHGPLAAAALDVFDTEPLPTDHPFRTLPNLVLSPHLGYVTRDNYRLFYGQTVEAIRAWLDGKPVRVIG